MGRPTQRDPRETRAQILEIALEEFAAKGYEGTRLDSIVKATGFNVNTIYYHFGSKDLLFVAVMEEVYRRIRIEHRELELTKLPPDAAIAELSRHIFRIFVRDQRFVALLNTENLYRAEHISKSERISTMYHGILDSIRRITEEGAEQGMFRRNVDSKELFITISALGYFFVSNQHTLAVILGDSLQGAERAARREQHVVEVVLGYLRDLHAGDERASP